MDWKWTTADHIKVVSFIVVLALAWARMEAAITNFNVRLDVIEQTQSQYVRSDLAQSRNDLLLSKIDNMARRLERIEDKLEK